MVEAVLWGAVMGVLSGLIAAIRGLPRRHAAVLGLGYALVFWALWLALHGVGDPGLLVLIAALGGGVAATGSERGRRGNARASASSLGIRPPPVP